MSHVCPRCHGTGRTRRQEPGKRVIAVVERECGRCGGSGSSPPIPYRGPILFRRGTLPEDQSR